MPAALALEPEQPAARARPLGMNPLVTRLRVTAQRLGPYLPVLARVLVVLPFLEDGVRICTQWEDQIWYLREYVLSYTSV